MCKREKQENNDDKDYDDGEVDDDFFHPLVHTMRYLFGDLSISTYALIYFCFKEISWSQAALVP